PLGIGAVADVVAEEDAAARAPRARVRETGRDRLAVGVEIREEREEHRPILLPAAARCKREAQSLRVVLPRREELRAGPELQRIEERDQLTLLRGGEEPIVVDH